MSKQISATVLTCLISFFATTINAQSGRTVVDLSQNNWKLWLDTAAQWQNDKLYAPPVAVKTLPVNLPTGGWSALKNAAGKTVHLPATVEEYYWGRNDNA